MVDGSLMQLIAYGANDVYLTGNPQIAFFKTVYRRHTSPLNHYDNNADDCKYIYKKYNQFKDKYNQSSCPICYDEYIPNDDIIVWGCQHIYHKECHHTNIKDCPSCRHNEPYDFSDNDYNTDDIIDYNNENNILTIII